jgi:hypothetical protein
VRAAVCAIVVMLGVAACGTTGGESSGLHDHGGPNAANVALVDNDVIVDVTLDPAKVGAATLHMEFAPPGGRLEKVGNVRAVLTNDGAAEESIEVTLVEDGLNHFHADVELAAPGDWNVVITADAPNGTQLAYRTTMTVGD